MRNMIAAVALTAGLGLAGCATGPSGFPVEATRFHYDPVLDRGTVVIDAGEPGAPPSLEVQTYAAAVHAELLRIGFADPGPGVVPRFRATVTVTSGTRPLPRRRSPISIGIDGGGYSGGYRGGGVGLGGGVSFPIGGGGGGREAIATELAVHIRRGPDAIWEGQARTLTEARAPDARADAIAGRLAHTLFAGFPGESGRTIEVR